MGNHQEDTLQSRLLNSNEFQQLEKDFFSQSWGEFSKVREMIMEENQKTWERFGEDFRNMSRISSSSMEQFHNRDSRTDQRCITPRENVWKMDRHLHNKESNLMKADDGQVKLSYDTSGYKPDELKVSVDKGVLTVEGKHEEKDEAGQRMVSRMFSRKQTLPKDVKSEDIVSNLSSEGVLTVTAPRNNLAIKNVNSNYKI